jgi:hypothetical protein
MSRDEIIQSLLSKIDAMNNNYIVIISIMFAIVAIGVSVILWIQFKLTKEQYERMKLDALKELEDKYSLDKLDSERKINDFNLKRTLSVLTMLIVVCRKENYEFTLVEQFDLSEKLYHVLDGLENANDEKTKQAMGKMLNGMTRELLNLEEFKFDNIVRTELSEIETKTDIYSK